jgi:hypothetical protein
MASLGPLVHDIVQDEVDLRKGREEEEEETEEEEEISAPAAAAAAAAATRSESPSCRVGSLDVSVDADGFAGTARGRACVQL